MNDDFIDALIATGKIKANSQPDRYVVYWNEDGDCYVSKWPDAEDIGHQLGFSYSGLDVWEHIRNAAPVERARHAAKAFDDVLIAGCDPQRAVREFMKIPEFRDFMTSMAHEIASPRFKEMQKLH